MRTPRITAVAVAVVLALGAFAVGCGGSSDSSDDGTTTTSVAKTASAWVEAWKPTLVSDYGPAQNAFLTAIQSSGIAEVRAAGQRVALANAALTAAITAAGAPPASDAPAATKLTKGLADELTLVNEVVRICTAPNEPCTAAVTAFAQNNSKQIAAQLRALGATG